MRIFKVKSFVRFSQKEAIHDDSLRNAVTELSAGKFDADLGGGLYKQRVARPQSGKSGGYRVLVCFKQGNRSFFVHGFAKSAKANISPTEKADLKKLAKVFFAMTDDELAKLIQSGSLQEISEE
ncbi:MAG: type II toxin-antitoxin system RelE/ParE family toxin [Pseudomonadota bacterium]